MKKKHKYDRHETTSITEYQAPDLGQLLYKNSNLH